MTQEVKREAFQPTDGSRLWGNASALAFGVERIPETVDGQKFASKSKALWGTHFGNAPFPEPPDPQIQS